MTNLMYILNFGNESHASDIVIIRRVTMKRRHFRCFWFVLFSVSKFNLLNSPSLVLTFRQNVFIKIMKFKRDVVYLSCTLTTQIHVSYKFNTFYRGIMPKRLI